MSTSPPSNASEDDTTFAISAVAKLTGISEHCLRIWERRYQVVEPARTETKRRRYTHRDVERLVLIKHLVDAGDTISSVASLDLEQLQERSRHYPAQQSAEETGRIVKIVIIGERVTTFLDSSAVSSARLEIVRSFGTVSEYLKTIPRPKAEVIVFDLATVHLQTVSDIEEVLRNSRVKKAVLVYGFAARPALQKLDRAKVVALRSPVDPHEIRIACSDPHILESTHEVVPQDNPSAQEYIPHRYGVDELARIAANAPNVECECPHHTVSLIFELNGFEKYLKECEDTDTSDAELHAYLRTMSSRARAIMEEALAKIEAHIKAKS